MMTFSTAAIGALAYSPDSRWIAGAAGRDVRIWQAGTAQVHGVLRGHEEPVTALAFSPDSQLLAAASNSGLAVCLWNIRRAEPVLIIPDALDGCVVHGLAFHPGGQFLAVGGVDWMATGGSDGAISFWDLAEQCEIATFGVGATAIAMHPSGEMLASAALDHALILWDTATKEEIGEIDGHDGPVNCVAFSPDGSLIASGGDDRTLRFWHGRTGSPVAVHELDTQVIGLCFAPDGRQVYTANANTTCYLVSVQSLS
jgi:WD40 repeat protein